MALCAIFLLQLHQARSRQDSWPWWWNLYKLLPLAAEMLLMLGAGLIDRALD